MPALPLEQQVAEKVHADTRTYGDGESSSRVKDLVDLILVLRSFLLQAQRLRTALEVTFASRREQSLPKVFPAPPHDWVVPFRKLAMEVGIDVNLENGYSTVAAFLSPVLAHQLEGRWEPNEASWMA